MKNRIGISIFYLSILLMGLSPVFFHVLLLRELLSNFFVNELIIAIFLAFWLVIEALGSGLLSKPLVKRIHSVSLYAFFLILNALLGPLCLFLSRITRNILFLEFGEIPNFLLISLGTLIVIFPLAAVDGCMFTAGYNMGYSFQNQKSKTVGHVYAVESLGAVLGGVFVTILIVCNLSPFLMVLVLSVVNIVVAISLNIVSTEIPQKRTTLSSLLYPISLVIVFVLLLNLSWLENKSTTLRWKESDVLTFKNSLYHNIVLTEKGNQKCLFVDGRPTVSLPKGDIISIEEFAHIPLLYTNDIKRILLIGEGPGGLISEFLKYPQLKIDYLQLDREIIQTLLDTHSPLIEKEFFDRMVCIVNEDAISYIKNTSVTYDAVFIAEECPSTFLSGRYFTMEFFANLKKILTQDGLLAIKTTGGESYINDELKLMLSTLYTTLRKSFHFAHFVPGENLILLASDHINLPAYSLSQVTSTLRERNLHTKYLTPYSLRVKYHPTKISMFQEIFTGKKQQINSVNKPLIVSQALSYESAIHDPYWGTFFSSLMNVPKSVIFFVFLFPLFLILIFSRISTKMGKLIIPLTIGLTGMAGMVGSMAITIFFQELFGSLYLKMGLLFSSFMLGLFVSALTVSRKLPYKYSTHKSLFYIECSIFALFLVLMPIFYQFPIVHANAVILTSLEISLYVLNCLLGCFIGIEFPVANSLMEQEGKEAGGILYACDLLGAFTGSIVVVTLVMPLMGFLFIFLLIASVKLINIFLILSKILSG